MQIGYTLIFIFQLFQGWSLCLRQQDNMSKTQGTALKQLKNDKQIRVYAFDKRYRICITE